MGISDDPEADVDPETQDLLTADFEIGHYIRDRIIPRAVLFFTGEALEEDDFDEGDEEGGEGEEEEDDPDFDPSKVKPGQNAQECKQQYIQRNFQWMPCCLYEENCMSHFDTSLVTDHYYKK